MMYCHAIFDLRLGRKMIGLKDLDAGNNKITKGIFLLQPSILLSVYPGGENSTKFCTGRLRPEVQPLNLIYTIFDRNVTPFVYLLLTSGAPFTYLV